MIFSISHAHLLNMPRPVIIPSLTINLLTERNFCFCENTQWGHTYFSHLAINMQKWCQFFHFNPESHVSDHTHRYPCPAKVIQVTYLSFLVLGIQKILS